MNIKILLPIVLASMLSSCDTTTSRFYLDVDSVNNNNWWTKNEIGQWADSTFTDSTDLASLLTFKSIDKKGNIQSMEMEKALELYEANKLDEQPDVYPFFEVKHSSNVILTFTGKGLWDYICGYLLLDKETMQVLNIRFDHKAETPGLGAQIMDKDFRDQFIGQGITPGKTNFALYQNDTLMVDGQHRIDGLTGATITSKGAIDMINEAMLIYQPYLTHSH